MNTLTPSRRNVMRALAALSTGLPTMAYATPGRVRTRLGPSAEWHNAIAAMCAASEKLNLFYKHTYVPVRDHWKRTVAEAEADLERRVAAIPHYETRQTFAMPSGESRSMSTAIQIDVLVAADFFRRRANLSREDADYAACCLELHPEAVRREEAEQAIRDSFTPPLFDPIVEAESDRLESESHTAWEGVTRFKASALPDLVAKITYLKSEDCEIDHDELLADLTGGELDEW